jgi:hypothetical protein
MRTSKILVLCLNISCVLTSGQAQGTFRNLDFESARLEPILPGSFGDRVPITDALPFWAGYLGTEQVTEVFQNNLSLGGASIDVLGPYWSYGGIIDGQYTLVLQPGGYTGGGFADASVAQIGRLPGDAQSIQMEVLGSSEYFSVSFAGQNIPLLPIGGGTNYTLYAGDISGFAGQTGELRLTGLTTPSRPDNAIFFDGIVFSPHPVPEPTVVGLFALGMLLLGILWGRESNRK